MTHVWALEAGSILRLAYSEDPLRRKKVLMHPQEPSMCSAALVTMEICVFQQTIGLNKYAFSEARVAATTCKHLLHARNNGQH